jgi:hypothetical protein
VISAPQSSSSTHVPDVFVPEPLATFLLPLDDILGNRYSISSKVQLRFTDLNCRITGYLDVQCG